MRPRTGPGDCGVVQRRVRLVEAFVPGLGDRRAGWAEELQLDLATRLREGGLGVMVIVIPEDETLLLLVWHADETDVPPGAADLDDALAGLVRDLVVERVLDARLITSV